MRMFKGVLHSELVDFDLEHVVNLVKGNGVSI